MPAPKKGDKLVDAEWMAKALHSQLYNLEVAQRAILMGRQEEAAKRVNMATRQLRRLYKAIL